MSSEQDVSKEDIREMSEKDFRKEFPSGWMELARYETLVLAIDALLESDPNREYTISELADASGSTERSLRDRIGSLVRLGVINELSDRQPDRYSLNEKSPIVQELFEINKVVEKVKNEELPQSLDGNHKLPVDMTNSNTFDRNNDNDGPEIDPSEIAARTVS